MKQKIFNEGKECSNVDIKHLQKIKQNHIKRENNIPLKKVTAIYIVLSVMVECEKLSRKATHNVRIL